MQLSYSLGKTKDLIPLIKERLFLRKSSLVKVLLILTLVEISLEADDRHHNESDKERVIAAKGG